MKKYTMPLIATLSLLASSVFTCASASASALKVAVVKHAPGSADLIAGKVDNSISTLEIVKNSEKFERSLGLCAAYIKASINHESEKKCTEAIENIKAFDSRSARISYLKSISYSNRGVARHLNKNDVGAMSDLVNAILIDDNPITRGNLAELKRLTDMTSADNSIISAE